MRLADASEAKKQRRLQSLAQAPPVGWATRTGCPSRSSMAPEGAEVQSYFLAAFAVILLRMALSFLWQNSLP